MSHGTKEFYHSSCINDFVIFIVYIFMAVLSGYRIIKLKEEYPKIPADKKPDSKYEDPSEVIAFKLEFRN